jgi:hypothetical protein
MFHPLIVALTHLTSNIVLGPLQDWNIAAVTGFHLRFAINGENFGSEVGAIA